jgi:hypothetical protein
MLGNNSLTLMENHLCNKPHQSQLKHIVSKIILLKVTMPQDAAAITLLAIHLQQFG